MNWRDWMYLDIMELLFGRIRTATPRPRATIRHSGSLTLHMLGMPFRAALYFLPRKNRDRIIVITQLARIVACNAPLNAGIEAILADAPRLRVARVLSRLRADIEDGLSLSEAMRRQPRFFPSYYVDLIRSGEQSGALYEALQEVAADMNEAVSVQDSVRGCLLYWSLLFVLGIFFGTFYGVKVLPILGEIYREFGMPFPWPHALLLSMADHVLGRWPFYLAGAALFVIGVAVIRRILSAALQKRTALGRAWSRILLVTPLVRSLWIQANLARAASILRRFLNAGYPLDEALDSAAEANIAPSFAYALLRMRDRVRQGESLDSAAEREAFLLPASFRGLVSIGESSGRLPETLERIAYLYRQQVLKMVRITADLVFPVGVFVMGGLVLLMASSLFMFTADLVYIIAGDM